MTRQGETGDTTSTRTTTTPAWRSSPVPATTATASTYPAASQYVTAVGGTSLTKRPAPPAAGPRRSGTTWLGGPAAAARSFEAKPAWQTDTGCAKRTVADVSAVADPETGVAVYQTFGFSGWAVYGGTSVSSPIIAGDLRARRHPGRRHLPRRPTRTPHTSALNDVTTGQQRQLRAAYLCTAGPGYDGPTGLGTPNGVAAFTTGPHGASGR